MNKIYFSKFQNGFFSDDGQIIPDDAVEISQDIYNQYAGIAWPDGYILTGDENGLPCWKDAPLPGHDKLIVIADNEKLSRLAIATASIAPLQDALDLDIATDTEQASLLAWKKYRVILNRIDTNNAPDIDWPTPPVDQAS